MDNEIQIIKECQSGRLEMFGALYDSYFRKIYDFIFYRTLHKESAQDLTSQTFFKALGSIGSFDPDKGQFSSWLYRIAKNNVIDHYRSSRKDIDIEDVWDLYDHDKDDLHLSVENRESIDRVKDYLKFLKLDQRQIVLMRVWDEMSYAEIAQTLGKSEDSCKMMFSRVMARMREEKNLLIICLLLLLF